MELGYPSLAPNAAGTRSASRGPASCCYLRRSMVRKKTPDIRPISVVTAARPSDLDGYVLEAYASLREQERPWEWLIQVDGRQRHLPRTLSSDDRIRIAWNGRRLGPAASRNRALARSSGTMIQNLDSDDRLLPGAIEALGDALTTNPEAAFSFGAAIDLHESGRCKRFPSTFEPGIVPRGAIVSLWRSDPHDYWVPIHPAGIMWRREVLVALGGWTALWAIDDTALLMCAATLFPAVCVESDTFLYRKRTGQLSARAQHRAEQIAFIRQRIEVLSSLQSHGSSILEKIGLTQ